MADELIEEGADETITKSQERITSLSSKVKETALERDEARKEADKNATKLAEAQKERDFYAGFSTTAGKYSGASEHIDAIKEKVMGGYTVEDATVSVLNAQGKLVQQIAPPPPPPPAAGGSASYTPPESGGKSVRDMTQAERRSQLVEAEKRGDISMS